MDTYHGIRFLHYATSRCPYRYHQKMELGYKASAQFLYQVTNRKSIVFTLKYKV